MNRFKRATTERTYEGQGRDSWGASWQSIELVFTGGKSKLFA
jgi:hypothetical protein